MRTCNQDHLIQFITLNTILQDCRRGSNNTRSSVPVMAESMPGLELPFQAHSGYLILWPYQTCGAIMADKNDDQHFPKKPTHKKNRFPEMI
jgi:hypothetical protein